MRARRFSRYRTAMALAALGGATACSQSEKVGPHERSLPVPVTFAVAPILNFSGYFDLDPVKAADLLASELSYVPGAQVLPVNRVVAMLASQGGQQITSPAHALEVAEAVGADAIVVAGVTEYDPYTPVIGLAVQIYARSPLAWESWDAVGASREAQPALTAEAPGATNVPVGQYQAVYNGSHAKVADLVRAYAKTREASEDYVFGWQQYLKVQTLFLRFCWQDAIGQLMSQEHCVRAMVACVGPGEDPA
jgi:hypothetical protein